MTQILKMFPKVVKFLAAGLPSFVLAVPLNLVLVARAGLPKAAAYAIVLLMQVSINFFLCRRFVFKGETQRSLPAQFGQFLLGISGFRLADWVLYSAAVWGIERYTAIPEAWGSYYVLLQFANVVLFAALKFEFSRRVMET